MSAAIRWTDAPVFWELWDQIDGYCIWVAKSGRDFIWNATKDSKPPRNSAGYLRRESLYKLKGIKE